MNIAILPTYLIAFLFLFSCSETPKQLPAAETTALLSPDEQWGELFKAAQEDMVFPDSKTFADCTPKFPAPAILEKFKSTSGKAGFDIKKFVADNFDPPQAFASGFKADFNRSVEEHINSLWDVLTRQPDAATAGTLIPLPKSYIVPGGRFGEIYYWDSYFTILGLATAERWDMVENMADNFAYLIDTIGFVPNGNRTYYLGRSQPPFFSLIVKVLAEKKGPDILKKYLPALEKEYAFWMESGAGKEKPGKTTAYRRMAIFPNGTVLNRYWDDRPLPRPEGYREDVALQKKTGRPAEELYRHLRAGAESGWDFSSRWFADGKSLVTIHTTDIIPVDLNCLLYHLEMTLAEAFDAAGKTEQASGMRSGAEERKALLLQYCWQPKEQVFMDYDFVKGAPTGILSLATVYPLFFKIASPEQAAGVEAQIRKNFLRPGGVLTTPNHTGMQWDAPNGWAPLQWMTIQGLRNYGKNELAIEIKNRWVALNTRVYKRTGKLLEKYNVEDMSLEAGGGEYPVQDGFGWTNGVLLRLLSEKE